MEMVSADCNYQSAGKLANLGLRTRQPETENISQIGKSTLEAFTGDSSPSSSPDGSRYSPTSSRPSLGFLAHSSGTLRSIANSKMVVQLNSA